MRVCGQEGSCGEARRERENRCTRSGNGSFAAPNSRLDLRATRRSRVLFSHDRSGRKNALESTTGCNSLRPSSGGSRGDAAPWARFPRRVENRRHFGRAQAHAARRPHAHISARGAADRELVLLARGRAYARGDPAQRNCGHSPGIWCKRRLPGFCSASN